MESLIPPLNDKEEEQFKNMMRRLHTIFKVSFVSCSKTVTV
jgi:hypothetical protein